MRSIGLALWLASGSALAAPPGPPYLAVGTFAEVGGELEGYGVVLGRAVAHAVERAGAYRLVAGSRAKDEAVRKILEVNRNATDERQWVEVGKAVGASHLLTGEVRRGRDYCLAYAEIVELESQAAKTTRPAPFDCTELGLAGLADELAFQLTGRRGGRSTQARSYLPPVAIRVEGDQADVDGRTIVYDDDRRDPEPARPPAPSAEPRSPEAPIVPPRPAAPVESPPEASPIVPPPPGPDATAAALVGRLYAERRAVALGLLALPFGLALLGGLMRLLSRRLSAGWFSLATYAWFAILVVEAGLLAHFEVVAGRSIVAELDLAVLLAAPIGLALLLLFASFVVSLGEIGALHHVRVALLVGIGATALVLVLVAEPRPVGLLVGLGLAFVGLVALGRFLRRPRAEGETGG